VGAVVGAVAHDRGSVEIGSGVLPFLAVVVLGCALL
jgi:hypothetical protein